MGYISAISQCIACKNIFSYNPYKVPSITIDGVKEPICLNCVNRINPRRIENGLDLIIPLEGAYEPQDENDTD